MLSSRARLVALGAVAALVLGACAPADEEPDIVEPDPDVEEDVDPVEQVDTMLGLEDCDEFPNECNSGPREEGGSITWIVNALPGAGFPMSPEGGSVYTIQGITQGILPYTGQWMPDGEYQFNMDLLAAEPELLSEDPFTYQFQIRDEAVWDDGTPISADDFRVLWMMSTPEDEGHCVGCRPRSTAGFEDIESIEGSDDGKTVTITLKEGRADPEWFGYGSSHNIAGGLVPAHIAAENGFDIEDPVQLGEYFEFLNDNIPTFSGGPYRVVEGDLENQVIKEPNPNWYGEVQPTLDTVIMRFLDDEGAWIPALQNREVHGSSPATFGEDVIRQVQDLPDVHVQIGSGPSWEHIDFNMDNEWFQDHALRLAIFTAIDAEDIAQRTYGPMFPEIGARTNHLFSDDLEFHVDLISGTGQGSGDVDAALAILEDAGYEFDGDTLTLDGEQVGPFRLRSTATPVRVTSMELIQSYLADIGIEIIIEPTDDLGGTLVGQDYDIMQFGWSGSPFFVTSPFQFWHSDSGSNFGRYSNPEVDELAAAAMSQPSLEEAADLANEAARIVTEDAYVLPLFSTPVYMFVTDEYVNIRDNSNHSVRALYNLEDWGVLAPQ